MSTTMIARSVHGLEWVAADEISGRVSSAAGLRLSRRAVTFSVPSLEPELLELRTVDDLFLEVGHVDGIGTTKDAVGPLTKQLTELAWASALAELKGLRQVPQRPLFDVVVSIEGRRTYNRFMVENEVGSALAPVIHGSHVVRTSEGRQPGTVDITVRIFLRGPIATAALRLGSRPLHRRAYKQDTGAGTLHPPVAAALVRFADPSDESLLLDPFVGDGTIAIEAAHARPDLRILAGDIAYERIANARRNAIRAGVAPAFIVADAGRLPANPGSVDLVVTNPPWNLAVDASGLLHGSLRPFWHRLPAVLAPGARLSLITDADLNVPDTLRRLGYQFSLATPVRLAGRVSHVLLASPPGAGPPALPPSLALWRHRAITAGAITDEGF